jgi:hypothetical protein
MFVKKNNIRIALNARNRKRKKIGIDKKERINEAAALPEKVFFSVSSPFVVQALFVR